MKRKSYNDHPLNEHNERTTILKLEKKQRRNDSIGWVIGALLVFFFTIIAIGRITLIGQFIDDIIFTFLFGWFKYVLYLLLLTLGITTFIGVRIKLKSRVRWMAIVFGVLACWLVSAILLIYEYAVGEIASFSTTAFLDILENYIKNWKASSIFTEDPTRQITFVGFNGDWVTLAAGGGIIGNVLAGVSAYLTVFGTLILCCVLFFFWFSWILTGSPIGIFLPKSKRHKRGIRLLKLSGVGKVGVKKAKNFDIYDGLDHQAESFSARQVMHTTEATDITIQMPSYTVLQDQQLVDDLIADDFLGKRKIKQSYVKFEQANLAHDNSPHFEVTNISTLTSSKEQSFNNQAENLQQGSPPFQYIQPRNRRSGNTTLSKDISDLPIYRSVYGKDVNLNDARNLLNSEASITPFGKIKKKSNINEGRQSSFYDETGKTQEFNRPLDNKQFENDSGELNSQMHNSYTVTDNDYGVNQIRQKENVYQAPFNRQNIIPPIRQKSIEINRQPIQTQTKISLMNNPNYRLPSLGLLSEKQINTQNNEVNKTAAQNKAMKINQVFEQFNIAASVQGVNIGPTITKFEIHMQPGVKVNKIMSLENDLKYALATQNIRIEAPIQGKSAVGIEIANEISNKVTLREIMERIPLEKQDKKLLVGIGRSVNGEIVLVELDKMPHLLVAGSTGSGKSVCINTILSSLLLRTKPAEVKLLLIDPKQVELAVYNNLPHLLAPVISDTKLANGALKKVISEMERRYHILSIQGAKNIETYNSKVSNDKKLPYIIVVIDELADLMMTAGKEIEDSIMRITQLARAAGIHMVIATQRPSTDVITGVIKTNIPSRIAFSVASSIDSRTILDQSGAEKLIGYGDMLYAPAGQNIPTRVQGAFIADDEIERLVEYCCSQQEPQYEEDFLNIENIGPGNDHNSNEESDPMYLDIKTFVITHQKASTSLIQRKFSIGYNRASRLMDTLEENGIIGPQNGAKARDVYVQNIDVEDDYGYPHR